MTEQTNTVQPVDTAPKADVKIDAAPAVAPKAVVAVAAKPAAAPAAKAVAKPAAKPAVKKSVKKIAKPVAKTVKKAAAKVTASSTKTKTAAPKIVKKAAAKITASQKKDNIIMTTTEKLTAETTKAAEAMTERAKALFGELSTRAKTAFEKGSELASQANEFNKGNVEALVESGKIAAKGAQELGQVYAEDTRKNFEELTATLKQMTTVKSPSDFLQLQTEMVRKSFDTMVAQTSKNSEAWLKLAGEVVQPISNRISVAIDTVKKAA